jgi:hypothetical protein
MTAALALLGVLALAALLGHRLRAAGPVAARPDGASGPGASWRPLLAAMHLAPRAAGTESSVLIHFEGHPMRISGTPDGRRAPHPVRPRHLRVAVSLPPAPLPWLAAARALGDGPLLAALLAPDVERPDGRRAPHPVRPDAGDEVALLLPLARLDARTLRSALGRLARLADALARLPLPEALARHLLDRAPPEQRAACFRALCALAPASPVTRQCALALRDAEEDPPLAAAARAFLAAHG